MVKPDPAGVARGSPGRRWDSCGHVRQRHAAHAPYRIVCLAPDLPHPGIAGGRGEASPDACLDHPVVIERQQLFEERDDRRDRVSVARRFFPSGGTRGDSCSGARDDLAHGKGEQLFLRVKEVADRAHGQLRLPRAILLGLTALVGGTERAQTPLEYAGVLSLVLVI